MSKTPSSTTTKQQIINTLCYADIFNYPLTREEIFHYLIAPQETTKTTINHHLKELKRSSSIISQIPTTRVGESVQLFALPNRTELFSLRVSRYFASINKKKITRRVGKWLKKIPTIKAVFITGALAMNNSDDSDDIDLMIVTSNNHLWTTRVLTNLLLDTINIRRKPEHKSIEQLKDKICTNLFISQNHLDLTKTKQNLYTAHEVAQAKLLWQKEDIHQQFLIQNSWINRFLPHCSPPLKNSTLKIDKKPNFKSSSPNIIEKIAYKAQIIYMKNKRTSEITTQNRAFFHPRNTSSIILSRYQKLVSKHKLA